MTLPEFVTKKQVIITLIILLPILIIVLALQLRRPPRKPMERYVPASALAIIEINDLPALAEGLTGLTAWRELAPLLGISSQLGQVGLASQIIGGTGIGPEEAVVASRAQIALTITDIEAETGDVDGTTNIRPKVALLIETHASPETTSRLLGDLGSVLATRIYGHSVTEQVAEHFGTPIRIFRGSAPESELSIASSGSVALIANHTSTIQSCLDAIAGRTPTLAENSTLTQTKSVVDRNSSVFAFVTELGVEKLVRFASAILATRFSNDPDRIGAIASLVGHLSKQTTAGFLYGSEFAGNGVTERFVTLLQPQIAEGLARALPPATSPSIKWIDLVPASFQDLTVVTVEQAGELPTRTLKELAPQVDTVAALALREFVLSFQKQLGLQAGDSLENALGSEVVLLKLNDAEPTAMLLRVLDKERLAPVLNRYLTSDRSVVSTEHYGGAEIAVSSHPDGRSSTIAGDYLILGTRDQIVGLLNARNDKNVLAASNRLSRILASRPDGASMISLKPDSSDAGEMMLAVARLTRVSDGSPELLEQDSIKAALEKLQPSLSITEFRSYGVYTETRSAVGSFGLIGSLAGGDGQ